MAAGRNVIGILGPAAAVGLGFFVPTVFYGVHPTPDTVTQLRTPYLSPPKAPRNNQIDASRSLNLPLLFPPAAGPEQLRQPVLSPPAKPRNNQIDASRPLNLAIQPVIQNPFVPVDYSVPHDVISSPPQATPYNINIFTNPLPFIPVDYNISHDVVSSPPQARPYNILLQTNPIPFGPYDYSEGATQFRLRVPDQFERNPNIYSEVPFVPVDYQISHDVANVPPLITVRNVLIYSEVPFGPFDWSKAVQVRGPSQLPAPPYNLNLYTVTVANPFAQYDWPKAIRVPSRAPDQIYFNYVLNILGPTVQLRPPTVAPRFRQGPQPPQPQPYNVNIYTNPLPTIPVDYNIAHRVVSSPPQPQPYNVNVFTNPVPFGPYDYNTTHDVISSPPWAVVRNPNIFSEVPITPIDWSARPQQLTPRAPDQIYYNFALNVTPPPQAPFAQYDWSKPFFPRSLKEQAAQTNINLYPNPIPLGPYDWSARPAQFSPRAPDQIYYNIALNLAAAQPPFIPFDWSKPFFPFALKQQAPLTNINLQTNPIPLGPYDWSSRPSQFPPRAPDQFHRNPLIFSEVPLIPADMSRSVRITAPPLVAAPPYNVAIYQPPPPRGIDFSTPRRVAGLPPQPQPYPINLLAVAGPAPFVPIDWSKPFAVRPVPPQPIFNITIKLPPPPPSPFTPVDYNRTWAVRIAPPQPYPNLTLFLPPPVIVGIPGLAFSKDFALFATRAYEMVLATARSADLAPFQARANNILTASAAASSLAVFAAQASEGGRQPGFGFRFGIGPAPIIVSVSPTIGYPGDVITISGQNLGQVTEVLIGGVSASFTIVDDNTIKATVP